MKTRILVVMVICVGLLVSGCGPSGKRVGQGFVMDYAMVAVSNCVK